MTTAPSDATASSRSLEETLAALDVQLGDADRQLAALLKMARRLRRSAREGALASLPGLIAAAQADAVRIGEMFAEAGATLDYDVAAAFSDGAWLDELAAAARAQEVVLVRRDGRITVYPVALRLDVRSQGVRIGRKLERRIRPSFLAAQLKALQQRPERFNARQFLDRLLVIYGTMARAEDPAWRLTRPGTGPLVPLAELYDQLTVLPAAAADYPQEEFVSDLLRLDRHPDATSTGEHRFELGGSTGRKGGKRLTMFDQSGEQHDYYAIRFILERSDGRVDEQAPPAR